MECLLGFEISHEVEVTLSHIARQSCSADMYNVLALPSQSLRS